MIARDLLESLAPLVAPALEQAFGRRDLCILATRTALDVAEYFGVEASPMAVRVMAYNAAFARHVESNFEGVADRNRPSTWGDESWSVGIGFGAPERIGGWDGHLIVAAEEWFGDYSIRQAERPQRGIVTGPAIVAPRPGDLWKVIDDQSGTVIEYERSGDERWRRAPDWKDEKRRHLIVGKLIRAVKQSVPRARRETSATLTPRLFSGG